MTTLDHLLDLQTHDTRADQLRHRRETLPERATLAGHEQAIAEIDGRIAEARGRRDELARDQRRIEDEVSAIEAKIAEVDQTLYKSGTITSPREAQVLSDELDSLRKRQRMHEDDVLELMEQIEPVDTDLARLTGERDERARSADEVREALRSAEEDVDRELAAVEGERQASIEGVDPAHLDEYDRLRRQLGGIGVARLTGGTCGGCNLTLSAVERDRIKGEPPDAVIHCEECGRLLVRS